MKNFRLLVLCSLILTVNLFGQDAASSTWALTADQSVIVTGNVTSPQQALTNLYIPASGGYSTSGAQRTSPKVDNTDGKWSAESVENTTRYMQFTISPAQANNLTVTSISLFLYANSGSNMRATVYYSTDPTFATKTQIGSTYSLSSTAPTVPNINATPNLLVSDGQTLYLRIYPWNTGATTGKYVVTKSVVITGTTIGETDPTIYLSQESLNLGNVVFGDTSSTQSYNVSGVNLTSAFDIQAPTDFQVSIDNTYFGNGATIPPGTGTVPNTQIFVRYIPSSASGTITGDIEHTSTGASTLMLPVNGVAITTEPTVQSTITFGNVDGYSINLYFSGGDGQRRIVVVRPVSAVNWQPTDGVTVGGVNSNYSSAYDQGNGNKIIYDGTGTKGSVTGLTPNTIYHLAVFEYNVGMGNSQNYLTTSPGTATQATPVAPSLIVSKTSIDFGLVLKDLISQEKSYLLSGTDLEPADGNITISAPAGFAVSATSGSEFSSSIIIPYSGAILNETTVYLKFQPTEIKIYSDTIKATGGNAAINTIVNGRGVETLPPPMAMIGYATVSAEGLETTTGGTGGTVTTVSTLAELLSFASSCENNFSPKILYISGKISAAASTVVTIKHGANISILGLGTTAELENVGLNIWDYNNVIIRNLKIHEVFYPNDAITINACHHVWIDHNELYSKIGAGIGVDTYDGLLDIKEGSRYVTVSWNYLHHHMKCSLIGHTDNAGQQATDSQMRITYHHNWFSYTDGRNPSIRFGAIHMFNNYFEEITDYGIAARDGAHAKLENNHYHNVKLPMSTDKFPTTLPNGYICETGNIFTGTNGSNVISQTGCDFWNSTSLPYLYVLDPVESVEEIVKLNAGVGVSTSVQERQLSEMPVSFALSQNYPNPFNPTTTITYTVPSVVGISLMKSLQLKIYDIIGREIATLVNEVKTAGVYTVQWDASNIPSGVYFCRLQVGEKTLSKKMVPVK